VRASDDFTQMGAWSDTISAPGSIAGIIPDNASYLQYRALLGSSGQDDTPSLDDVTVTWNNLGIPGEALPQSFTLFSPCPNPVRGGMSVTFSIPAEAVVELTVYDLAGRAVFEAGRAEYQEGSHEVMLGDLPPGVYLVAGRSDGIRRTARFTVLK